MRPDGTCVVYLYQAAGGLSKKSAGGVPKIDSDAKSSGAADDNINHSFKDIFVSALKIYQQLYCKVIFVFASLI